MQQDLRHNIAVELDPTEFGRGRSKKSFDNHPLIKHIIHRNGQTEFYLITNTKITMRRYRVANHTGTIAGGRIYYLQITRDGEEKSLFKNGVHYKHSDTGSEDLSVYARIVASYN